MEEHEDVNEFMWVLTLTDDKVTRIAPSPPPLPLTTASGNTAALGATARRARPHAANDMIYSLYILFHITQNIARSSAAVSADVNCQT